MRIEAKVRYFTNEHDGLCFRHAVHQAMQNIHVHTEVYAHDEPYYCDFCLEEMDERIARQEEQNEERIKKNAEEFEKTLKKRRLIREKNLKDRKLEKDQEEVREEVNQFIQGHLPKEEA